MILTAGRCIYLRNNGIAMGSSSSVDISLTKLEKHALTKQIDRITFYKRYLDDIVCASNFSIQPSAELPETKFTLEMESVNGLPFLEVFLARYQGGLLRRPICHKK